MANNEPKRPNSTEQTEADSIVGQAQRRVPKAPPPIGTEVRGIGMWNVGSKKPAEVPNDFPPEYPPSLRIRTGLILAEVVRDIPDRGRLMQICTTIVERLTPLLCTAVSAGTIKDHQVPDSLNQLLHYIRVTNCDNENERFRLETAVKNSEEWYSLLQQLDRCHERGDKSKISNWGELSITFVSDHAVRIVAGNCQENANYGELGFEDGRNGKPKAAWDILRALAESGGTLTYSSIPQAELPKTEKRIQELREFLRHKFSLISDPIPCIKGEGYKCAFIVGISTSYGDSD
jgi:hypothetical protein